MKKWTAILLIISLVISMVVIGGCQKKQMEEKAAPEAVSAPADSAMMSADSTMMAPDSADVDMEMDEMTE